MTTWWIQFCLSAQRGQGPGRAAAGPMCRGGFERAERLSLAVTSRDFRVCGRHANRSVPVEDAGLRLTYHNMLLYAVHTITSNYMHYIPLQSSTCITHIYILLHAFHAITSYYMCIMCITYHYILSYALQTITSYCMHYRPLHCIICIICITYHYILLHSSQTITSYYIPLHLITCITYDCIVLHELQTITSYYMHYRPLHLSTCMTYHYIFLHHRLLHLITYNYILLHALHKITWLYTLPSGGANSDLQVSLHSISFHQFTPITC